MRSLEFFRNVSIGQYIDTGSRIHRFTPTTKYLWLLALMAPAIAGSSFGAIIAPCGLSLVIAAFAEIKISYLLRGIKSLIPLLAFFFVFQLFIAAPGDRSHVIFSFGILGMTTGKVISILFVAGRMVSLMLSISLFTAVTSDGEVAHGIEDIFSPLTRIGFPSHDLSLSIATAFRFIPIVVGELESIVKAQAARGADFGSAKGGPIKKARAYIPLFVPVTIRALERAELLAEAMEARCYTGGDGRTRLVVYKKAKGEYLVRIGAILFCAAAFALDIA